MCRFGTRLSVPRSSRSAQRNRRRLKRAERLDWTMYRPERVSFHEKASQEVRLRTPHFVWRVPERHASIRTLYGSACDPVHVRVRRGAATYRSNSLVLPAGNRFKRAFAVTRTGRKDPLGIKCVCSLWPLVASRVSNYAASFLAFLW